MTLLHAKNEPLENPLFPVFLKLENLKLLIVGGGNIGLEKLQAVLNNAPKTKIKMIAIEANHLVKSVVSKFPNILLIEKAFDITDVMNMDIAIIAINDARISAQITAQIKSKRILCNVADKPELCDFYLGSIVQKGELKIAISTNGKSPTIAKRIKELLHDMIPENINESIQHLEAIKKTLKGDFAQRVEQLNTLTKNFIKK